MRTSTQTHLLLILALFAVMASGCATRAKGPPPTATFEEMAASTKPASAEIQEINARLMASLNTPPEPAEYTLGPGDLLQVSVVEAEELKAETRVGARGTISLPLLGPVMVMGLTPREAEQKIEDLYRAKYLHDPHVNLFVKEQYGQKIVIVGAVKKPGTYDYPLRRRLLDTLAFAEGLTESAGRTVQVKRAGSSPDTQETLLIDMDELIRKGRTELNVEIKGGDVIFVPEAGTVYVDGAVKRPGPYRIRGAMTIQEAIITAGGLASFAKPGEIKLIRYLGDGKREVVQLNEEEVIKFSELGYDLKDRDVIFVESNLLKASIYGLNVGVPLFGSVSYSPAQQ